MEPELEVVTTGKALPEETPIKTEEEVAGTTETLFGSEEDDTIDVPKETPKEETVEPEAKADEAPTEGKPVAATTEEPKEELITVKVDGVEKQVTQEELIKGYQTDQYLTEKGQKIAKAGKSLGNKEVSTPTPTVPVAEDDAFYNDTIKSYIPNIKKDLGASDNNNEELQTELSEMRALMGPAIYEQGLKGVDAHIKSELGQNDFMDYKDKIEAHITSLPLEEWDKYDSVEGMTALYSKFKMTEPIVKTEAVAPGVKPKAPVPIPSSLEGGSGVSGGTQDGSAEKTKIFNKAKETGIWEPYFLKYG